MHGCAYAAVDNLMQKGNIGNRERGTGNRDGEPANAERPSFVVCHWSLAAANKQAGERETRDEGQGARELPKRQTAADGRESGFGGREPAHAGRPGTEKARDSAMARRRRRTFGGRPGRAPAPLVIRRPKAGARPGLHTVATGESRRSAGRYGGPVETNVPASPFLFFVQAP